MRAASPSALPALRQLLRERFPTPDHGAGAPLATGIPAVDERVRGLPRPGLTELVCSAPSCGSQLFLGQLLAVTREAGLRAALVDAGDAFDPSSWPGAWLEHLIWVRARGETEALAAADLLARDANFALVILDVRHAPPAGLRRIPATQWYRLQHALASANLAVLVLTPSSIVPSAQLRLELAAAHPLAALSTARPQLTGALAPAFLRQRTAAFAATA